MKNAFIVCAIIFAVTALILCLINKKEKSVAISNIGFVCFAVSVLMVGCLALGVDELFVEEVSTQYQEVTTSASTTKRNNGRPVKEHSSTTTPDSTKQASAHKQNQNNSIVYITKSGKKYHLSYTCGGNEYYECTLTQAIERGLTPCKRCAQ